MTPLMILIFLNTQNILLLVLQPTIGGDLGSITIKVKFLQDQKILILQIIKIFGLMNGLKVRF